MYKRQTISRLQIGNKVNKDVYKRQEYGSTDDARMDALDQNRKLAWLLKRATDRNGNYILYNYDKFPEELTGEVRLHLSLIHILL